MTDVPEPAIDAALAAHVAYQREARQAVWMSPSREQVRRMLQAAVPFYGRQPSAADAAKIKAPLLVHDAEKDEGVLAGWPAYEAALKAAGVSYQHFVYPNAQHGFNNDTTPRFDPPAAKLAWERTLAFFSQTLRA